MTVPPLCTIELTLFFCEQRNKREQNWFSLHFLSSFPCSYAISMFYFIYSFLSLPFEENGVALTIVCEAGRLTGTLIDICLSQFVDVTKPGNDPAT